MNQSPPATSRRQEWRTFLLLTVVLIPLLSVLIVAGYGFSVWFLQLLFGPPATVNHCPSAAQNLRILC